MKKLLKVFFAFAIAVSLAKTAPAADLGAKSSGANTATVTAPEPTGHTAGPMDKAQRGFNNAAFGWTEIPKKIVATTKETRNPFAGLLIGGWQGSCKAFARTASGASELVTFPIGRYDRPYILPDMPAAEK